MDILASSTSGEVEALVVQVLHIDIFLFTDEYICVSFKIKEIKPPKLRQGWICGVVWKLIFVRFRFHILISNLILLVLALQKQKLIG